MDQLSGYLQARKSLLENKKKGIPEDNYWSGFYNGQLDLIQDIFIYLKIEE